MAYALAILVGSTSPCPWAKAVTVTHGFHPYFDILILIFLGLYQKKFEGKSDCFKPFQFIDFSFFF